MTETDWFLFFAVVVVVVTGGLLALESWLDYCREVEKRR